MAIITHPFAEHGKGCPVENTAVRPFGIDMVTIFDGDGFQLFFPVVDLFFGEGFMFFKLHETPDHLFDAEFIGGPLSYWDLLTAEIHHFHEPGNQVSSFAVSDQDPDIGSQTGEAVFSQSFISDIVVIAFDMFIGIG